MAEHLGIHWNTLARQERDEIRITEPMARLIKLVAAMTPAPSRKGRGSTR